MSFNLQIYKRETVSTNIVLFVIFTFIYLLLYVIDKLYSHCTACRMSNLFSQMFIIRQGAPGIQEDMYGNM